MLTSRSGAAGPVPGAAGGNTGAESPGRSLAVRLGLGVAAAALGALSGIAAVIGMGLALLACCAGPALAAGAAAGSSLVSGSSVALVWLFAAGSGLAAFLVYRLAVRRGRCGASCRHADRRSTDQ